MSLPTRCELSESVLARLAEFVEARFGLHFPRERWRDLERAADAAADECGQDASSYIQRLLSSTASVAETSTLASHITIGETYFFRETRGFRILEHHVVPNSKNRQLRIWSAGCATGEEPYSIAMLLRRIIPDLSCWNLSILGTDVNARSIEKAQEGIYGEWSFRGVPEWIRSAWFSRSADGRWIIDSSIKNMVRISYTNLALDNTADTLGAMDVIFCCNVLMYFSPRAARQAVDRLHQCLRPGGWLFVGPAETSHDLFRAFEPVSFPEGMAYRRPWPTPTAEPVFCNPITAVSTPVETASLGAQRDSAGPAAGGDSTSVTPTARRNPISAMVRLARACANRGDLREAFRWCEMAIATGNADARVHYLRAAILEEQGLLDEAARSLRRAVYLDPDFVMGHFALGNLAAGRGRLTESAKHFENTMALLAKPEPAAIPPESGGLTAARLKDLIMRRINAKPH